MYTADVPRILIARFRHVVDPDRIPDLPKKLVDHRDLVPNVPSPHSAPQSWGSGLTKCGSAACSLRRTRKTAPSPGGCTSAATECYAAASGGYRGMIRLASSTS